MLREGKPANSAINQVLGVFICSGLMDLSFAKSCANESAQPQLGVIVEHNLFAKTIKLISFHL